MFPVMFGVQVRVWGRALGFTHFGFRGAYITHSGGLYFSKHFAKFLTKRFHVTVVI